MSQRRKVCLECRKSWRRTNNKGRHARNQVRKTGRKLKSFYPDWIYHTAPTRLCERHHAVEMHYGAIRRARKRDAMPDWADREAIKEKYREAQRLTRETGVRHEVDHIDPLCHPLVCGLHVAENLQVITRRENCRKSNKFKPYSQRGDQE